MGVELIVRVTDEDLWLEQCVRVGKNECLPQLRLGARGSQRARCGAHHAATLPFSALLRGGLDSQSMVFFSTPGTPWLYSGVAMSNPSACRTASRSCTTPDGTPAASISALYSGIPSRS